jgi:hypothetical protein
MGNEGTGKPLTEKGSHQLGRSELTDSSITVSERAMQSLRTVARDPLSRVLPSHASLLHAYSDTQLVAE